MRWAKPSGVLAFGFKEIDMFQPDGTSAGVKPLLLAPTHSLTLYTVSSHKSLKINAVATTMFS